MGGSLVYCGWKRLTLVGESLVLCGSGTQRLGVFLAILEIRKDFDDSQWVSGALCKWKMAIGGVFSC